MAMRSKEFSGGKIAAKSSKARDDLSDQAMPKPLTVVLLTIGLIIAGLLIANSRDRYVVNCLCAELPCACPHFMADAVFAFGLAVIAAGASLPIIALASAGKKAVAS